MLHEAADVDGLVVGGGPCGGVSKEGNRLLTVVFDDDGFGLDLGEDDLIGIPLR